MSTETVFEDRTEEKEEEELKHPDEFLVILLNDDYTTMDFVVDILMIVFHKSLPEASRIMLDVHRSGTGIGGAYSYDIAVTKVNQVQALARQNQFPLKCAIERL
jgi:ATP-dependent Clp protease adaptor protein ClpS